MPTITAAIKNGEYPGHIVNGTIIYGKWESFGEQPSSVRGRFYGVISFTLGK